MKKFLVLMAPFFAIALLTACGEGGSSSNTRELSALELLSLSHEAQDGLESFVMETTADISIAMVGLSMDMPMSMLIQVENENSMRMTMEMSMMGISSETLIYVRDGYLYSEMDLFGEIIRDVQPMNNPHQQLDLEMFDTTFLTEEFITYHEVTFPNDGYRLFFELNLDGLFSFLDDFELMEDLFDFSPEDMGEWAMTMVMYLDENHIPISSEMLLSVDADIMGVPLNIHMDMVISFIETDYVTIDFPAWLDEL